MKLTRQDIGGELISIITKGMYADPRDAIREYIQNGIDANAETIRVRIRYGSIAIIDDGEGMDNTKMRRAVRVGISDKNPSRSVGFMGIGLYSSFHLCDTLSIYSKVDNEGPARLTFMFKEMREQLELQKETRIAQKDPIAQVDLQTLLEKNIVFESLEEKSYPKTGTRVEMHGLEPTFFKSLSKFDEVAEYLESVVPLPFSPDFTPGKEIQAYIDEVCKKHRTKFRLIKLFLDINSVEKQLFRPYTDADFKSPKIQGQPLPPKFWEMRSPEGFLGIAWACLNKERDTIPNAKVRGFIIKKQGFTIGKRSDVLPHFKRSTYFNRAVGEFLVLNNKLLPNAPRSDFEFSSLRTSFYSEVINVAKSFFEYADNYQEVQKASSELIKAIELNNTITAQLEFFESNSDKLLEYYGELDTIITSLNARKRNERFTKENEKTALETITKLTSLKNEVKQLIDNIGKKPKAPKKAALKGAPSKKFVDKPAEQPTEPFVESLDDLLAACGFTLTEDLSQVMDLIDEKFIKSAANSREKYRQFLLELRNDIEDLLSD